MIIRKPFSNETICDEKEFNEMKQHGCKICIIDTFVLAITFSISFIGMLIGKIFFKGNIGVVGIVAAILATLLFIIALFLREKDTWAFIANIVLSGLIFVFSIIALFGILINATGNYFPVSGLFLFAIFLFGLFLSILSIHLCIHSSAWVIMYRFSWKQLLERTKQKAANKQKLIEKKKQEKRFTSLIAKKKKLQEYKELFDEGLISEKEYEESKKRIIEPESN